MTNFSKSSILFILLLFTHPCFASQLYTPLEEKAAIPLLSPSFSAQTTEKILLNNGLKAYLVSDPTLDKSSGIIMVKAGSWEDPPDLPGIAHFHEHMLFLGTKRYPVEAEFDQFMAENGGVANAFTAPHFTSYLFSIDHAAYPEALDRFASFFIEPLFHPSGLARELQAIDQEYAKNLENDAIRKHYVLKELASADHPEHAFSMGNCASLMHISRDKIVEWHQQHYSANKMTLILHSNHPPEELRQLAVERFSLIPNRNLPQASKQKSPFLDQVRGSKIYIEPIKNARSLTILWELPSKFAEMRAAKPEKLICHVLEHQGSKSLAAQLKKEKLLIGIKSDTHMAGSDNLQLRLILELTDLGMKNLDKVILRTYQALANLKQKGIPRYLFEEMHKMDLIDYQYQSKQDAFASAMLHAVAIAHEPLETYPEETWMIQQFAPIAIQQLLEELVPAHALYIVLAPEKLTGVTPEKQEAWLNVKYAVKPISKELLEEWEHAEPHAEIDLPDPNPFIPEKPALSSFSQPKELGLHSIPLVLLENEHAHLYYAQDDRYKMPQIAYSFEVKTPAITPEKPETQVLADLYIDYCTDALHAYTWPAELAGLQLQLTRSDNGICIHVNGYSDKADQLFIDFVEKLKELHPKESKFKQLKEKLLRRYQDAQLSSPLYQASELLNSILHKEFATHKTKSTLLKKISLEQFESFVLSLYKVNYIEGLFYGNLTEHKAHELAVHLDTQFSGHTYPKEEHFSKQILKLSQEKSPVYCEMKSKVQGNAVILAIEEPVFSFKAKAAQQILMQGMKSAFFSTLRTKQQTGYIVTSRAEDLEQNLFNLFCVQSNTHDGRDLLSRFELFIEEFMQEIEQTSLTLERFQALKTAHLNTLKQPLKTISEMQQRLSSLLFDHEGDLDYSQKCIQAVQELTYPEFLEQAKKMMNRKNNRRVAVLVSGNIPEEESLQYKKVQNISQIRSLGAYRPKEEKP